MIVGAEDGALRVYDLMDPKLTGKYEGYEGGEGHMKSVTCVAFPSEGAQYRYVWPCGLFRLLFIRRKGAVLACVIIGSCSLLYSVGIKKIRQQGCALASQTVED